MSNNKKIVFICITLLSLVTNAWGSLIPDKKNYAHFQSEDLTWFGFKIYQASLYHSDPLKLYDVPFIFEIKYNVTIPAEKIVKTSEEELTKQGVSVEDTLKMQKYFIAIFPSVKKDDVITCFFDPQKGLKFFFNDELYLGSIERVDYAKKFLDIWLGEKTSEPKLRKILLGDRNEK